MTTQEIIERGAELQAEEAEVLPAHEPIPVGPGSKTALGGIVGLWATAILAAVSAGTDFYTDNGVITLLISAGAATLAFLGLRLPSVQLGVTKAAGVKEVLDARYNELMNKYEVLVAAQDQEVQDIIEQIEGRQDDPDLAGIADEVVRDNPEDEATDTMAPS